MRHSALLSETSAHERLRELLEAYPLPNGWTLRETFLQEVDIGSLALRMVGLIGGGQDQDPLNALGSAAQSDGFPVERAYFELLERISIHMARSSAKPLPVRDEHGRELAERSSGRVFPSDLRPDQQRLSLSNGVALHTSWTQACAAACEELVERDRVLRSFAGELAPVPLALEESDPVRKLADLYEVTAFELGVATPPPSYRAAMLLLSPRSEGIPLIYGFGGARGLADALAKAEREALQRLAFLWGEDLPETSASPAPTPDFHHDFYLYPPNQKHLQRWLQGQNRPRRQSLRGLPLFDGSPVVFVDLTPECLRGKLAVAKASSPSARRLRFGAPAYPGGAPPHPMM